MNLQILPEHDIHINKNEVFRGGESALMAFLIFKRFNRDLNLAHTKWMQMLGNNCSIDSFKHLVYSGSIIMYVNVDNFPLKEIVNSER